MQSQQATNHLVARTFPPAKLNLFLELLARRDDGFHEIDTVMVPINWYDQLVIRRTSQAGIRLNVCWLPSMQVVADRLGIGLRDRADSDLDPLLDIPSDERNLVHRALVRFTETFDISGGFSCDLRKSIPAGAGMGGASSDAASALRSAARLAAIPLDRPELSEIAASLGSDVPFFLGGSALSRDRGTAPFPRQGDDPIGAARATGRGERLEAVNLGAPVDFVVVFPGVTLSTAKVYANSQVPRSPQNAYRLIELLGRSERIDFSAGMINRLSEPAKKLAPQINEILESLWRMGLRTCQLTGSGSACFAVASSPRETKRMAARLRAMLEPGAIVMATRSTSVPAPVEMA